jgi:hypothetical protein
MCGSVASSDSLRSIAGATRRPRTLSTAFPNSRSRMPPRSTTGIRVNGPAYTPARDGGLHERACSTAFRGHPAKAEPSRLCETSRGDPHPRRALQRASVCSQRRSPPSHAGLLLTAVHTVEGHLQVRSCKPNPLGADVVHVRDNRRHGAGVAGRFDRPGSRVKIFDHHLVHALIGGKDLDCRLGRVECEPWADARSRASATFPRRA